VSGDGEVVVLATDKGLALFSARAIAMAGRGVPQEQLLHSAQLWNPPPAFTVSVNPRKEWMQMYDEAMRNMRDAFYDPNMHGVDWAATTETYRPLVYKMTHKVRSIHWSPYDRVRVVNADP
jgi:tricorn protease